MGKYRYARSNGEFLPSRFVERVQSVNPDFFATEEAYNLTKDFVSGSGDINSFVSKGKISGYTKESIAGLVAWYRLGQKDNSNVQTVQDSSGNGHIMTGAVGERPTISDNVTPSKLISKHSFLFDGSNDQLETTSAASAAAFTFADGTEDKPFSVSCWVKGGDDDNRFPVAKGKYNSDTAEWSIKRNTASIALKVYDTAYPTSNRYSTVYLSATPPDVADWVHIVTTYDGNAAATGPLVNSSDNGMKIYINGVEQSVTYFTTANYTRMQTSSGSLMIGGFDYSSDTRFPGNIADVAVWDRELSSAAAVALYAAKTGVYREVRNYDQVSPENDTRVLGVKSSGRGFNVSGFPADMMDGFRQGINVVTFKQLVDYTSFKIRPNSSFITTINGKDVPRRAFDESIAMTTFPSGTLSGSAHVSLGGVGRLSKRLSHERELRDLGQTDVYVNLDGYEAYEDTLDLDPVGIINTDPLILTLPRQLVVQTSNEMMDGAIEPLVIRAKIDNSSIEGPFFAHDFRADLGGATNAFRRSIIMTYGWDLDEPAAGSAPFLDSSEAFAGSGSNRVDLPGAFSTDFAVITPYVDSLNDRDKEYTTNSVSTTISNMLIVSGSFVDDDMRTHDKMAHAGFVFDNNPIGIDSIAYGGLKK